MPWKGCPSVLPPTAHAIAYIIIANVTGHVSISKKMSHVMPQYHQTQPMLYLIHSPWGPMERLIRPHGPHRAYGTTIMDGIVPGVAYHYLLFFVQTRFQNMHSDMKLTATDATDAKTHTQIRRFRDPNPIEDVPDQDPAQKTGNKFEFYFAHPSSPVWNSS